ncbi:DUF4333 domain-containing protein [Cellulomonas triticagri]|uniref:DUF4333 domain-containing protein n=1 Tax=Cellulomonas triticagri TaxID=2483352 RepID=A0A3M2JDV0_9CELL|nr:DUF4333 domain-containing protein [Cellulomonas triticagri]RMI09115.1 DUF4333 domain-containing protein [Cellulomonas triticagri]
MRTRFAGPAILLALTLSACSVSAGVGTVRVAADDLESKVTEQLTEMAGQAPDALDCPEDLPGEVDASVRCTLTAGSDRLGVTVTVTEVEGTDVAFAIQVDDEVLAEGEEA